jgi:hypothetical protein
MTVSALPFAGLTFGTYASDGDKIEAQAGGLLLVATLHADDDTSAPWDREDGHGPVSDWCRKDTKSPGEVILNEDHGSCRFYDMAEAVKIAKRDGWGTPDGRQDGERAGAYAARAAAHDFAVLKAWSGDEWQYVGVAVQAFDPATGLALTGEFSNALWGVEANYPGADNAYLVEVANELASEVVTEARASLTKLAQKALALEVSE